MTEGFTRYNDGLFETLGEFCSFSSSQEQVQRVVEEILQDIKLNGDEALLRRTLLYDKATLTKRSKRLSILILSEILSLPCLS
mgnify:CR=1 FL=1